MTNKLNQHLINYQTRQQRTQQHNKIALSFLKQHDIYDTNFTQLTSTQDSVVEYEVHDVLEQDWTMTLFIDDHKLTVLGVEISNGKHKAITTVDDKILDNLCESFLHLTNYDK